ncbi:hypothetical protein QA640_42490 [Bradyrhizobium sp. CB82]|uniref:hypothetical protein n=1 Tax=Bradyrhizobium sp. CB82 TaxID=3039159 RepID=UPI0024B04069|nr:hypothetical protein [Bradyrhizobium sp. CB82]WFU40753.1 hypothetical protein QA640_42490 [Bradyrhizobium sp. CB82]
MLLRVAFYSGTGWRLADAVRIVAVVALLVLGRTGTKPLVRMKRKHWRPGGRDVLVVTSRGVKRMVPVVPALRIAVEPYLDAAPDKRPNAPLLQTTSGNAQSNGFFGRTFFQIDRHLGFARSSKTMLRRFCSEMLGDGDVLEPAEEAALRYFESGDPAKPPAKAPLRDILALFEKRDPFGGALPRALGNDRFALELARRLGTDLPDKLQTQASREGKPRDPRLGPDHPFVAWLLAQKLPVSRIQVAAIETLVEPRKEELVSLIESGDLPRVQACELLGLSRSGLATLLARLNMTAEEKEAHKANEAARRRRPQRRRPRSTEQDRAFIGELRALRLAKAGKERLPDVDRAIRKFFPKAAELLNRRILTTEEAADLFGLHTTQISGLKLAFPTDIGLKTAKQRERHRRHVDACEVVLREWDSGDADETNDDRHQRLKDRYGFQFGRDTMVLIKRYAVANPPRVDGERSAIAHAGLS